jgi:hypothetical protein
MPACRLQEAWLRAVPVPQLPIMAENAGAALRPPGDGRPQLHERRAKPDMFGQRRGRQAALAERDKAMPAVEGSLRQGCQRVNFTDRVFPVMRTGTR